MTVLTEDEWTLISSSYECDKCVNFIKLDETPYQREGDNGILTEDMNLEKAPKETNFTYIFEPAVCEQCVQQSELDKHMFENKKIFIRQVDDDAQGQATPNNDRKIAHEDDCEIIQVVNEVIHEVNLLKIFKKKFSKRKLNKDEDHTYKN